ncbi:MAG: hypothetical protein JO047_06545 [Alphaproteobacteria bacterium]|nr:hypothetical protein [Alphaproteobacteria bacterium]
MLRFHTIFLRLTVAEPARRRRLGCAVLTLLLLAASCGKPAGTLSDREAAARLGEAGRLVLFYAALAALERGERTDPVTVLQIGDSHTANDAFSGRMRELFQARFGDAGRGVLPPGIPYRWYKPARVHVAASGWGVVSSFDARTSGPFGLTGLRQHADGPADMMLSADAPGELQQAGVEVLQQPGGGTLEYAFDGGASGTIATDAPRPTAARFGLAGGDATALTLRARGDGPVDVLAWWARRRAPGVIWANLGTVGATVDLLGRWDLDIVAGELASLHPALIVVAFGTNEAFKPGFDTGHYGALYAERVRLLRAAAPDAALAVIGPPDANRRAGPGTIETQVCGRDEGGIRPALWAEPDNLAQIRDSEHEVADADGYWFWDWSEAMGGRCSMWRLVRDDPTAAAPDHVHLFAPGYRATAERLFAAMMDGYERYLALKRER